MNRSEIRMEFQNYTAQYDNTDERILLKAEHTQKVAALCDRIADSLGFTDRDTDLAWLIGMLHDIGRFEQVARYGTFQDARSVDHAAFGADLLFSDGLITRFQQDLSPEELEILEAAIRQHNVLRLRADLDDRTRSFCNLIRDADKLDIMRVNVHSSTMAIFGVSDAVMQQSAVSPAVLEAFSEEHCIDKSIRSTPADLLVSHIAMAFELIYPESRRIVLEQGNLLKMLDFRSENQETAAAFSVLRQHMLDFLKQ